MAYSLRLPISALIFYIALIVLILLDILPSFDQIYFILKSLYEDYGNFGLFIASFLEGIVYLGLYFPGSVIIVFACFFSDGSFKSLFLISLTVALALTLASILNYFLGKNRVLNRFLKPKQISKKENSIKKKSSFLIFLHPNILAFYFYTLGAKNESLKNIIWVPIVMIPLGFILAFIFYTLRNSIKEAVENPFIMISILLAWFIIALLINYFKNKK